MLDIGEIMNELFILSLVVLIPLVVFSPIILFVFVSWCVHKLLGHERYYYLHYSRGVSFGPRKKFVYGWVNKKGRTFPV